MDQHVIKSARISPYIRERIISLRNHGMSIVDIRSNLIKTERIKISRQAISAFLKRYKKTCSIIDTPKINSKQKLLSEEHLDFIDSAIINDREISARDVVSGLSEKFDIVVSTSTVKRARRKLGWKHSTTQYCQMVRDQNKPKRLQYALSCIANQETFDDVIFTDETTVKIQTSTRFTFRKEGEMVPKGKPKHPYQVHVWGGISRRGATGLFVFTGRMDSDVYQQILMEKLVPFINNWYPNHHRLMQDNDPKHVSRSTKEWMDQHGINHWPTPPESPDLNPIENIWAGLKYHIRRYTKPHNQQDLIQGIIEFWERLTPEICSRYIDHLYKVIPVVVEKQGSASGF